MPSDPEPDTIDSIIERVTELIIQRQDRFYVVAYDGLDPLTGKECRRWHPAGHERAEAEAMASRLALERHDPSPKTGGPVTVAGFLGNRPGRHAQAGTTLSRAGRL